MQIYLGSYDGFLTTLLASPTQMKIHSHFQLSTNSVKSVCLVSQSLLAAGGYDQELRVIDLSTKKQKIQAKQNQGQITQIKKLNQKLCLVGIDDGTIRIWNTLSWMIQKQVKNHKKAIRSIFISENGKIMVTADAKKIIVWNTSTITTCYEYKLERQIDEIALTNDLSHMFIVSQHSLIEIDPQNNNEKQLISLGLGHKIQCLLIFKNLILIGTDTGQIQAWQIGNYEFSIKFKAHQNRIKAMKIIQFQGFKYLIVCTSTGDVSIWDFIQFVDAVESLSQNYVLDDLKPLTFINTGSRILTMQVKVIQNEQKAQIIPESKAKEKIKTHKTKKNSQKSQQNPMKTKKIIKNDKRNSKLSKKKKITK